MADRVRVLLVDDSAVVRRMLSEALSSFVEIEVVGQAANGIIGLSKIEKLQPDAVILDVEMPEMDGITMLINLRTTHPHLPVIMFSTLTERGVSVTFDALAAGASDYVLKPSGHSGESLEGIVANSLVPKLMALTRSRFGLAAQAEPAPASASAQDLKPIAATAPLAAAVSAPRASPQSMTTGASNRPLAGAFTSKVPGPPKASGSAGAAGALLGSGASSPSTTGMAKVELPPAFKYGATPNAVSSAPPVPLVTHRKQVQIIAIAASTGGPNALADVVERLPKELPVPIVIVQHMPPIFTRGLAERLASRAEVTVLESAGGERLLPGHVYIAPGNRHLEVQREAEGVRTLLTDGPPENSCRPAADVMFRSVVRAYGGNVLAIVLTGMGQDGARGAREVYDAGGRVLVQSGPTCVVWGMPKAVEEQGIAEAVVPLPEMAAALLQRVGLGLTPLPVFEARR